MEYETLDNLDKEERLRLLLQDSTKYIRMMSDSDIDRLLANLAKRPIKEGTQDAADLKEISRWWSDRYPRNE